jgi:transposase
MDQFNLHHKQLAVDLTFKHSVNILGEKISVAFYDVTTLYFEASDEDDLRKLGFSKDGKAQNPQVLLGLLVGLNGYPLAYEVFEGNRFEGHTLLPVIEAFKRKYEIPSLIIIADAGLLSKQNIAKLNEHGYPFILGARMKSEQQAIQEDILSRSYTDGQIVGIERGDTTRLLVSYSAKRARKDEHTRKSGLTRLEQNLRAGKLSKKQINNRGYNKYLKIKGEIEVEIDHDAFKNDQKWNGLKGYITNTTLSNQEVIENYRHLWNIEKAFRISKTDLRIRPIYHRLERRIRTHICIAFCSYKIYKELERQLRDKNTNISVEQALMLIKTIYQIQIVLPVSRKQTQIFLQLSEPQKKLLAAFGFNLG